ncbi:S-adenosyl-L-methionine-dependent methyltransferase [Mycena sanguinolenta]|uniref:S-adenosyl-L-methionine-dependent methyltransferase n=1 Tax=Mycena sanguinolenta TaxID=230812 RepID=A0A8H7DLY8_9AGAR|nr:S-adenosyl-L-methionine-dependent methyltransferase [Mycena sanguinolenta]
MTTPIRQLLALITKSVETIEVACQSSGTTVPDLRTPFTPPSEDFRANPEAAEAARIIAAAALQLEAIVTPPFCHFVPIVNPPHCEFVWNRTSRRSYGLHVKDIAAKNGQDPEKLARFLRYLATHHVFREISPNVFGHTRISSMLDTHKSSAEIFADPEHKHDGTGGFPALLAHFMDETFKASAYAWETLSDPTTRSSGDPTECPFSRAIGRPEGLWTYFARPEGQFQQHRFNIAMQAAKPETILNGMPYDWGSLSPGSLVVDVGGGVGTLSLTLAAQFPQLKFVVQDQENVIEQGKKVWNEKMPNAISSGQVTLQDLCDSVHDFFTPQPQTGAAVYLMKFILHDWSTEYCIKILTQLSEAAAPTSTLLLLERLLPLAVHDPETSEDGLQEAPEPLLANYGGANDRGYMADFVMFLMFNSQERTRKQFTDLLTRTGWEFVGVHRRPGGSGEIQCIEAKKAAAP